MLKKKIIALTEKILPFIKFRYYSYSQDGEDMVLKSFFENQRKYKGFYVDIGAHHPFRFSNTAYFYKKGWRGINVEPTPTLIGNFKRYRKRDINLNVAISNSDEPLVFYQFDEPALNSFDEKLSIERSSEGIYKIIKKTVIKPLKLAEVLQTYLSEGQKIDFLTIDVEGFDLDVLKSNDWNRYMPTFILVECSNEIENIQNDSIFHFLKGKSYDLVCRTQRTSIFKKGDNLPS